jgi:3-deoxy-manno-octulosonate cytidylyltransferase (CMP-KDO synthetase)
MDLGGKPMIQWVVERANRASMISQVIVATDDDRIFQEVKSFGAEVIMTPKMIPSGTDRVAFAAKNFLADIVVNIQGDEPFIEPEEIDHVTKVLIDDQDADVGTLVKRIYEFDCLEDKNTTKVVINEHGYALYFSRSPIPFCRDGKNISDWTKNHSYYKHIGIYSYRKDFLELYSQWKPSSLEKMEKLEQLRVLEKGYRIKIAETMSEQVCVDTYEDLEKARRLLKEGSIKSALN